MAQQLDIRMVTEGPDLEVVQALTHEFMGWVRTRYADERWLVDEHYDPEQWHQLVANLGALYAPPAGAMLLARCKGEPVGCITMQAFQPGICEMKRLFVVEAARGLGVARALCQRLIDIAAERGYHTMRLETGFRQHEAIALYQSLGFDPIPAYRDHRPEASEWMLCMERHLIVDG